VADLLGVAGARAEPQGQVPAQVGADGGHGEPGRGQRPAVAGPAAGPGGQRAGEQRGRAGLADGVHQADPLLVPVQRRPVGQAGCRRGRGARDPGRDEHPGRAFGAAEQVEQDCRGPAAKRQPDQRGMRGLAERDAVQGVGARPGRQRADDRVGKALDHRVEGVRTLDALGEGRRPGQQAGLAGPARAQARGEEGLPHVLVRTRHPRRLSARSGSPIKIAAQPAQPGAAGRRWGSWRGGTGAASPDPVTTPGRSPSKEAAGGPGGMPARRTTAEGSP
jgi:hypothetical protein